MTRTVIDRYIRRKRTINSKANNQLIITSLLLQDPSTVKKHETEPSWNGTKDDLQAAVVRDIMSDLLPGFN